MVGTMALIIVLSVFNGFEGLITSLFNAFNPDFSITAAKGKTFDFDEFPEDEIKKIPGVFAVTQVVEENALLKYRDKQYIATVKGVSGEFEKMSGVDTMLIDGKFVLKEGGIPRMIMGAGVAYYLGASLLDLLNPITVYVPQREGFLSTNPDKAFVSKNIFPSSVFSIQQEFDSRYVVVPVEFMRELLNYNNEVTSVEIGIEKGYSTDEIETRIKKILGPGFSVKNRFEQEELLYKIMRSEKWAIFFILTFILIIATFNVISSLTMLILDKKKDIAVLHSMGASNRLIRRIFLTEGIMISVGGALSGLIIGGLISWIQQNYGIISLGGGSGSFVVDAYPVKIILSDFFLVFATVVVIGFLAAWYPAKRISEKYLSQKL